MTFPYYKLESWQTYCWSLFERNVKWFNKSNLINVTLRDLHANAIMLQELETMFLITGVSPWQQQCLRGCPRPGRTWMSPSCRCASAADTPPPGPLYQRAAGTNRINRPDRLLFALQTSQQSRAQIRQYVSTSLDPLEARWWVLHVCVIHTCCTIVLLYLAKWICSFKKSQMADVCD